MISRNPFNLDAREDGEAPCLAMRPRKAAMALGISERLLWEWTSQGKVPHVRIGKAILYPTDTLRHWLNEQAEKATPGEGGGDVGR